jgi:signal transduction histidine kinase
MDVRQLILNLAWCLLLFCTWVNGQAQVEQQPQAQLSPTESARSYIQQANQLMASNPRKAISLGNKALQLAEEIGQPRLLADAYNCLGSAYKYRSEYNLALEYLNRSLEQMNVLEDQKGKAFVLNNIGTIYYYQGNYSETINYFKQSLAIKQSMNDSQSVALTLNNIGVVYKDVGDFSKALNNHQQALTIYKRLDDKVQLVTTYINLGALYFAEQEYDQSLNYVNQALTIDATHQSKWSKAVIFNNIGNIYKYKRDYKAALVELERALVLKRQLGDRFEIVQTLTNISDLYLKIGNIQQAEAMSQEANEMATRTSSPYLQSICLSNLGQIEQAKANPTGAIFYYQKALTLSLAQSKRSETLAIYELMSKAYENTGNYALSLQYLNKYNTLKDSLFNTEKNAQFSKLQTMYNTNELKLQNQLLEQQSIIQHKQQNILIIGILASLLLFVSFAGIAIVFYRTKERVKQINLQLVAKNAEINQQREEIQAQADQLELAFRQLKELGQFKADMTAMIVHDLKNPLNTIINLSDQPPNNYDTQVIHHAGQRMLNYVMNLLDVQKFEHTEVVLTLGSVDMDELITDAVQQTAFIAQQKNLSISYPQQGNVKAWVDRELMVRVLVNLLTNAVKYTPVNGAIFIDYGPAASADQLQLTVRDTGVGIPPEKVNLIFERYGQAEAVSIGALQSTGLGLTYCKMVLDAHGGNIRVESELNVGTTFFCLFPLDTANSGPLHTNSNRQLLTIGQSTNENSLTLSDADLMAIKPFVAQLQQLKVYQISEIDRLVSQVPVTDSQALAHWREELENTVFASNEKRYQELIDLL